MDKKTSINKAIRSIYTFIFLASIIISCQKKDNNTNNPLPLSHHKIKTILVDPKYHPGSLSYQYTYDKQGRIQLINEFQAGKSLFTYSEHGAIRTCVAENGDTKSFTTFRFNDQGFVDEYEMEFKWQNRWETRLAYFTYNADGRLIKYIVVDGFKKLSINEVTFFYENGNCTKQAQGGIDLQGYTWETNRYFIHDFNILNTLNADEISYTMYTHDNIKPLPYFNFYGIGNVNPISYYYLEDIRNGDTIHNYHRIISYKTDSQGRIIKRFSVVDTAATPSILPFDLPYPVTTTYTYYD